jgi:phage replication-related protein YjqB (UPF0714/DUF867 family)
MRLGVALPIVDIGGEPAALKEFAQAAEAIGYHGIAAPDHVLGANGPDRRSRNRIARQPVAIQRALLGTTLCRRPTRLLSSKVCCGSSQLPQGPRPIISLN